MATTGRGWPGVLLGLLALLLLPLGAGRAQDLPAIGAARAGATVSGISSGAFMAVQMQVAFSARFTGVGAVAGGPYLCAEGSLTIANLRCLEALPPPDAGYLWRRTLALAAFGHIDPVEALPGIRAYVFHGKEDRRVRRPVVESLIAYWQQARVPTGQVLIDLDRRAGHGFVVQEGPVECGVSAPPFLNDCDHDQAGVMLAHLLALPAVPPPGIPAAPLRRFDQAAFRPGARSGMDGPGFLYVPPGCEAGGCRVHIAFHGCRQGEAMLAPPETFVRGSGYLQQADALRLVLLFPQVAPHPLRNPIGCWDFWGYSGPDYATRRGAQMRAVIAMLDRLQAPAR